MLATHDAVVEDISIRGLRLTTRRRLVPGGKCRLKMWNREENVFVVGRVAWCVLSTSRQEDETNTTPFYTAGLDLSDGNEETARRLERLITTTCLDDRERRRFDRYPLTGKHSVDVRTPIVCRGVQINRGGMLVETLYNLGVGTRVVIGMELDGVPVKVRCHVTHSVTDDLTGITQLGLEFQHFDPEGRARFHRFMEQIEKEAGAPPMRPVH